MKNSADREGTTPSKICRILHILRKSNSIHALLFIQNNSKLKTSENLLTSVDVKFTSIVHLYWEI